MRYKKTAEDHSVKFHRIGKVEFWLTPLNKVFLIIEDRVIFPSLQGTTLVRFDDPTYEPSKNVLAFLFNVLMRQHSIREGWPTKEEDELAYEFS